MPKRRTVRMIVIVTVTDDVAQAARKKVRNTLKDNLLFDDMKVRGVMPMPRPAMFPPRSKYQPRQGTPPLLKAMGIE